MRIRVRFEKTGPIRYVGHLDFMRTFQKIIRRSGLDAVYTSGFNPHILLSFADPLGVGQESVGEYADIEVAYRDPFPMSEQELYRMKDIGLDNDALPDPPSSKAVLHALNASSAPGVFFRDAVRVGLIRSSKAMSIVRYASWQIHLADSFLPDADLHAAVLELAEQPSIIVHKVTKKSEKDVDIRPQILSLKAGDAADRLPFVQDPGFSRGRYLTLMCASGSFENLKPQVIAGILAEKNGAPFDERSVRLIRTDLYDADQRPLIMAGGAF